MSVLEVNDVQKISAKCIHILKGELKISERNFKKIELMQFSDSRTAFNRIYNWMVAARQTLRLR